MRDYGKLLADDPRYAARAQRITELVRDISEVVAAEWREDLLPIPPRAGNPPRIAWQSPCSLQHGQGITGVVERSSSAPDSSWPWLTTPSSAAAWPAATRCWNPSSPPACARPS